MISNIPKQRFGNVQEGLLIVCSEDSSIKYLIVIVRKGRYDALKEINEILQARKRLYAKGMIKT